MTARLNDSLSLKAVVSHSYPLDVSLLLTFQELQQLSSSSIVPDQVGIFRVAIQQLQDLNETQVKSNYTF